MGKQWKQLQTLFWGAPNSLPTVTAAIKLKDAGVCYSHEIKKKKKKKRNKKKKTWKKSYGKTTQHIKKQRHYFANKVCLVKAMVFPVVMYGCKSWTIKKDEHQRIDAFEL